MLRWDDTMSCEMTAWLSLTKNGVDAKRDTQIYVHRAPGGYHFLSERMVPSPDVVETLFRFNCWAYTEGFDDVCKATAHPAYEKGLPHELPHLCKSKGGEASHCAELCHDMQVGSAFFAKARPEGGSFTECSSVASAVLAVSKACKEQGHDVSVECGLSGEWSAPRPAGMPLHVLSHLQGRPSQIGALDSPMPFNSVWSRHVPTIFSGTLTPSSLARAGQEVCSTALEELPRHYSNVPRDHLPWLCADISYQYALLVDGLGVAMDEKVHLLRDVGYRGSQYSAKWPLGDALFALMDANFTNALPPSPPLPPPAWT
ncbi:GDA1/CD39 nucleoside phosphatase protein, partial [Cymbomonas tetramitiformis]